MPSVVNEADFQREVLESSCPVLVHFWTPWCGLCQLISPMLETMQGHRGERLKLVAINADDNFKLATAYRLKNLPTIMVFNQGRLIQKLDNFNNRDCLRFALEKIINNLATSSEEKPLI